MKILNVAFAAAFALVGPYSAMATTAGDKDTVELDVLAPAQNARERIALRVSVADIDVTNPQSLERLRARVSKAIAANCNPGGRLNADETPDWQCRREMGASANAALYALARQGTSTSVGGN